ncbi:MAG: adenine phosphoribosyltransferase [Polyangiaceae bacterium]
MSDLKSLIRTIPDFPKPGIQFRDVTTLFADASGFAQMIDAFVARYAKRGITKVAAIEARGFILGGPIAHGIGAGFVPVRKKGKLPGESFGVDYALEYGTDRIEIHVGALVAADVVLVVDDLIATGGTATAAIKLVEASGAKVHEACFIVDLPELGGAKKIEAAGHTTFSLVAFEGH